jgi:hypothetical protein
MYVKFLFRSVDDKLFKVYLKKKRKNGITFFVHRCADTGNLIEVEAESYYTDFVEAIWSL